MKSLNNDFIHWNQTYSNGIEINDYTILNTLLFADEQVLLSDSEGELQRALHTYTLSTTLLNSLEQKYLH
jgi:hypothetical protein